ncbi:MAG: class I SAM-dependent methyltransferase [Candidatus Omnitrophica bacterium]|nr:class I SAM-dependent methyltransferase [Candidatus Omnitrophota bacterium]
MNRVDLIQEIINKKKAKNYLEIGFGHGDCFFNIRASRKMVVDPEFVFLKKRTIKYFFRNLSKNLANKFYNMPSDDFFIKRSKILQDIRPDVVFVDGLHTFKQSLKDVNNAIKFINDDGVIVLHDCSPSCASEAYPAKSYAHAAQLNLKGWTGYWSGDVWKTPVYLRSLRGDLKVFVLDFDRGVGIVRKGKEARPLEYTPTQIEAMTYHDLDTKRAELLNLKRPDYAKEFIETL